MIAALIERLEKATGPDRQLDYLIFTHFAPKEVFSPWSPTEGDKYTSSIEEALALAERVLPGWGYYLRHDKGEQANAGMTYPTHKFVTPCHCQAPTMPLAICIAILKAKQAQKAGEGA